MKNLRPNYPISNNPFTFVIMERKIKIGTRGSKLALWQANYLQQQLLNIGLESEIIIIKTKGDQIQHLSFDKLEGKGFFTKELEEALLIGAIDMAVHSMKDLPTTSPEGLVTTAVSYRENPVDILLINKNSVSNKTVFKLKEKAVVGTSSARRKAQLLDFRPDLQIKDIRGNVPTRIQKLKDGHFDAIVLAAAGIERLQLDLSGFETIYFNPKEFVPAPAQGVLAYQCCADDLELRRILKKIHHPDVSAVTNIERKVLQLLDGGCQLPLGVYCEKDTNGYYHVWAAIGTNDTLKRTRLSSTTTYQLAEKIVAQLT